MSSPPILKARNLRREVQGRCLFDGISFSLLPGETLAIQAPSGTGKTALLRALAWLDPLQGGTVLLEERSPADWGVPLYRRQVAYIPQKAPRLEGSPAESWKTLAMLSGATGGHKLCPLNEYLAPLRLPATVVNQAWTTLSGGEAQRLALALALCHKPKVLLLDEPTASLDEETSGAVEELLKSRTALWVTHDHTQAERIGTKTMHLEPRRQQPEPASPRSRE